MSPTSPTTIWCRSKRTSWNEEATPVDGHMRIMNSQMDPSCAKLPLHSCLWGLLLLLLTVRQFRQHHQCASSLEKKWWS